MKSQKSRLRHVYSALDHAQNYGEWQVAAAEHDSITGAMSWRKEDSSQDLNGAALRRDIAKIAALKEANEAEQLAVTLHEVLYRHQNDLTAPSLYSNAMSGTKHVVEDFLTAAVEAMWWLSSVERLELSDEERLARFSVAAKAFGRSALMLSGGATLGFHHMGVVQGLFELDLLPDILSGASAGAMIAAGVCAKSDDELRQMFADPTSMIRLDGIAWKDLRRGIASGALLDPERLNEVLLHNIGDYTFAEAFARGGRALNISVSPVRHRQKPRLLTHLTAPDVLVTSAVMASSALPGFYPPVQLLARHRDGHRQPHLADERWVDGSLHGDLPKLRLSRLHNVNHFIVSQTNPHVLPFVRHHGQAGVRAAMSSMLSSTVVAQSLVATGVAKRLIPRVGPLQLATEQAHSMLQQEYTGDITIHPQFHWRLYRKVIANPSPRDLHAFMDEGRRSVWPKVAMIRNQTRISRAFQGIVCRLKARRS